MPFSEKLTLKVRKHAHFQCCLCKAIGVEIHHIVPQSEGGTDTVDNAAPLCPSCHEIYGANPIKRKFIREARDLWFEICDKRYAPDSSLLHQVHSVVTNTASKEDVSLLRAEITNVLKTFKPTSNSQTLSIPLNQSSNNGTQELSIRDLLVLVVGTSSERLDGQVELLCLKELWPIKEGYRETYNEFSRRFGSRTLRFLASRALDELKVPSNGGLTEGEITEALGMMTIEAVCMIALDKGDLHAKLNEANEIAWWARDS